MAIAHKAWRALVKPSTNRLLGTTPERMVELSHFDLCRAALTPTQNCIHIARPSTEHPQCTTADRGFGRAGIKARAGPHHAGAGARWQPAPRTRRRQRSPMRACPVPAPRAPFRMALPAAPATYQVPGSYAQSLPTIFVRMGSTERHGEVLFLPLCQACVSCGQACGLVLFGLASGDPYDVA